MSIFAAVRQRAKNDPHFREIYNRLFHGPGVLYPHEWRIITQAEREADRAARAEWDESERHEAE